MIYTLYNKKVEFSDDLKIFVLMKSQYAVIVSNLIKKIEQYDFVENNPSMAISFTEVIYNKQCNAILSEVSKYGLYDKTVDDFKDNNPYYRQYLELNQIYQEAINKINLSVSEELLRKVQNAATKAQNQVKGLDFGILSNDILSLWIYDSMNNSEIRRNSEKAKEQFDAEYSILKREAQNDTQRQEKQFLHKIWHPQLIKCVENMYIFLLYEHVKLLMNLGVIDGSVLNDLDEERSNRILDNINVVNDKNELIITAVKKCPYNANIYKKAIDYNRFDEGMIAIINDYGLKDEILQYAYSKRIILEGDYAIKVYTNNEEYYSIISKLENTSLYEVYKDHYLEFFYNQTRILKKSISILKQNDAEEKDVLLKSLPSNKDLYITQLFGEKEDFDFFLDKTNCNLLSIILNEVSIPNCNSLRNISDYFTSKCTEALSEVNNWKANKETDRIQQEKNTRKKNVFIICCVSTAVALFIVLSVVLYFKSINSMKSQIKELNIVGTYEDEWGDLIVINNDLSVKGIPVKGRLEEYMPQGNGRIKAVGKSDKELVTEKAVYCIRVDMQNGNYYLYLVEVVGGYKIYAEPPYGYFMKKQD